MVNETNRSYEELVSSKFSICSFKSKPERNEKKSCKIYNIVNKVVEQIRNFSKYHSNSLIDKEKN